MRRFLAFLAFLAPLLAFAGDAPAPASPVLTAFMQYVVPALVTVLGPLLVLALGQLAAFLRAKAGESKAAGVALVFTEAAHSVVAELEVTLKPQLQAALSDGVLTQAEQAALKKAALDALKTRLPATALQSASAVFGPMLDTWLGGLIERAVTAQKPPPVTTLEEAAAVLRGPQPA